MPALLPDIQSDADASMLTRRFGKEVINYYAGSRLNRYSFLRGDTAFQRAAAASPAARFVALKDLSPVVASKNKLALLTYDDVKPIFAAAGISSGLFAQSDEDAVKAYDSKAGSPPLVVFLGIVDTPNKELAVELNTTKHGTVHGQPFFAVDVTPRGAYATAAEEFLKAHETKGHSIQENTRAMTLNSEHGTHV